MRTADFDYTLPTDLIAQQPTAQRDQSRLLVMQRDSARVEHRQFCALREFLRAGDVLVLNNSRVIPARLRGVNVETGGAFEMLLLEENAINDWWVMLKPGKRAPVGTEIKFTSRSSRCKEAHSEKELKPPHVVSCDITATVIATNEEGHRRLRFAATTNILDALDDFGEVPLPPYIRRAARNAGNGAIDGSNPLTRPSGLFTQEPTHPQPFPGGELSGGCATAVPLLGGVGGGFKGERRDHGSGNSLPIRQGEGSENQDRDRYQTVFAQSAGSVAAPTAGLHFTEKLLDEIRLRGVDVQFVTLHVGLGTFAPVKAESLDAHVMHAERYEVGEGTARAVNEAKAAGRRVIAVGTTSVRVLESAFRVPPVGGPASRTTEPTEGGTPNPARVIAGRGRTKIFIHPPHDFHVVDALLTNFHLPCSTLLMLVSAFAAPRETRGRELILSAYAEAIRKRYRFLSYGDAMLIL